MYVPEMRRADCKVVNVPLFILHLQAINRDDIENWDKEMMLVVNVQSVNGPNVGIPSVVGFYSLNNELKESGGAAYFSHSSSAQIQVSSYLQRQGI